MLEIEKIVNSVLLSKKEEIEQIKKIVSRPRKDVIKKEKRSVEFKTRKEGKKMLEIKKNVSSILLSKKEKIEQIKKFIKKEKSVEFKPRKKAKKCLKLKKLLTLYY